MSKFKKYSSKLKEQILNEYFDGGKSPSYLFSKYGISKCTITVKIEKLERIPILK